MSDEHSIVWTLERDFVTSKAICEDDNCLDRYACAEECEVVYDVRRDAAGVTHGGVTHGVYDWDGVLKPRLRHEMRKGDHCNVVEFLNADQYIIPELNENQDTFEIGRTAIEPVWHGEDGVTWKRPIPQQSPVPQTGEPKL